MISEKPEAGKDYNNLIKQAQQSVQALKQYTKAQDWYKAALESLSNFTQIKIQNDGSIQIFGYYQVIFDQDHLHINPPDVYIDDIIRREDEPLGTCIIEVIERILELQDFQKIAQQLGCQIITNESAPLIQIQGLPCPDPPIFSLIGYQIHPLVQWGTINVEQFNSQSSSVSMLQRIRNCLSN